MKRIFTIVLAALAIACTPAKQQIRTGDLFFVGIPGDYQIEDDSMDAAIIESTVSDELNLIHAGILEVADDGIWVIDATLKYGVDRHPLDTMLRQFTLKDGSMPTFIVKRLKEGYRSEDIDNAMALCGLPYDDAFLPDNGKFYCTELIRESYRKQDGEFIFPQKPMNWKNSEGEIPPYWTELFGLLGMDVPQDVPGTNPHDMALLPILEDVDVDLLSLRKD